MTLRSTQSPERLVGVIVAFALGCALALAPAAQAETTSYRISQTQPFEMALMSCTGELVALAGTHHFESNYRVTVDLSGARFHSQALNKYSLRGTGTESGALYQNQHEEMSEHNGSFTLDPFGGGWAPYEQTDATNMVLIRQGDVPGDDLYVRLRYHITYTANGVVITRAPTLEVICR